MNLVILGDPVVKKNTKKFFSKGGRVGTYYSKRWTEWEENALLQIKTKGTFTPLDTCKISLIFFPRTARRFDLTNMAEGIQDVLVKANVLKDDSWKMLSTVYLEFGKVDKENPRIEVELNEI